MKTRDYIPQKDFITRYIDELSFSDLQIIALGYEKNKATKPPMSTGNIRYFSLHFVLSGAGYYEIEDTVYRLTRNCIFLIYPNSNAKYYPDKTHPWTYTWINFTGSKVLKFLEYTSLTPNTPVGSFKTPKIGNILLKSLSNEENTQLKDFNALHCLYEVLHEIIHSHPSANITQKNKEDHITLSLKYLNENYANPHLNLQLLSDYLHLNPSYLSRILKQRTGSTFTDFLMSLRMQNAIKLMESGIPYVNEISRKVGFSDPYYFSKTFKKYANISPKAYIQELENRDINSTTPKNTQPNNIKPV